MSNTNSTIKVTRVNAIEVSKALVSASDRQDKDEIMEVLDKMLVTLSKKSVSKADKERIAENDTIKATILDVLANGKGRVSDITKGVNDILGTDYTSNKVSAQVTVLKNDGMIIREVDKKVAYFSIA